MAEIKAYFFVQPTEKLGYQHNMISLAQGFRALGIPFSASADFWREADGNLLFRADPSADPRDFDIVITSEQFQKYGNGTIPEAFFASPGKKVFVSTGDGVMLQMNLNKDPFRKIDHILTFQYDGLSYPANTHSWAFGMTQQMIELGMPGMEKRPLICINYRNGHSVRNLSKEVLFDQIDQKIIDSTIEQHDWMPFKDSKDYEEYIVYQSAGRHNKSYRERIASSVATSAFGGHFYIKPWVWNWITFKIANYFVDSAASIGRMNNLFKAIGLHTNHTYRIYQWDSWRFWEAFAGGSMAINVDFPKYHIRLPEMPENYKHYLGVDLRHPEKAIQVLKNVEQMRTIGAQGHEWALKHYAPKAQAERLLKVMKMG